MCTTPSGRPTLEASSTPRPKDQIRQAGGCICQHTPVYHVAEGKTIQDMLLSRFRRVQLFATP